MGREDRSEQVLHASLYEIECGLFCVTYRSGVPASSLQALPIYQLGNSESEAKRRIEQSVRDLGCGIIIWEGTGTAMPDVVGAALRGGGPGTVRIVTGSHETSVENL